ncbi:MAG: DUF2244 domain-containing protein [Gammaproteobacteria bacterium]|nr:DUF2244 domain-containing protein [Gammaproteobacteria bacterium]
MIAQQPRSNPAQTRFVIRPNRSLSWWGSLLVFFALVFISFGIAGVFALKGYWIVFPFAGLEMSVLGVALYLCAIRTIRCEVICVENNTVEVIVGRHQPERRYRFDRHWVQVILSPPKAWGHPSRLLLRSHGRELEVGSCLNNEERQQLAKALEGSLKQQHR